MERMMIWVSRNHHSVQMQVGGLQRDVSGKSFSQVIENMNAEDRKVLVAFCRAVVAFEVGNHTALEAIN